MPRDEIRPIHYTRHAEARLQQRDVSKADVERAIRSGAWQPGEGGNWITRAYFGERGSALDVVFVETGRGLTVLLVITVIAKGRYLR